MRPSQVDSRNTGSLIRTQEYEEADVSILGEVLCAAEQSHIDYVVEIILKVFARREQIHGMKLTYEAPFMRHFTAHLEPMQAAVGAV